MLTDEALTNLILKELERLERANRFFDNIDKLAALEPPLTPEEIAAEIEAYRSESA